MFKDLNAAQDLARRSHTSMPMTALCPEIHRMLTAAGLGGEDRAALMEYFTGLNKELVPWSPVLRCLKAALRLAHQPPFFRLRSLRGLCRFGGRFRAPAPCV
jgi:hypothetical protein